MEKKGVSYQTLIIIVIIAILVSVVIGIFIGAKVIKKADSSSSEEEKLPNITITQKELDIIGDFVNMEGNITTGEKRIKYVDSVALFDGEATLYEDSELQPFPYMTKEAYNKKYAEIFGDNYSIENDIKEANSLIYSDCSGFTKYVPMLKDGDYICWSGAGGVSGTKTELKMGKTEITKDSFTVTGKYTLKEYQEDEDVDFIEYEGDYTIKYTIKDSNKYLKSIEFSNKKKV